MSIMPIRINNKEVSNRIVNAICIFSSLISALFPCVYLIIRNYNKLGSDDLLISLSAATIHWLLVFLFCFLLMKNINKAALGTILVVILLSIFHSVQNAIGSVFSSFYYWHGVILVITFCSFFWITIQKFINQDSAAKLSSLIGALFLILIIVNTAYSSMRNPSKSPSLDQVPTSESRVLERITLRDENLPNIYLFIFDEYSGYEALQRYTGYNNEKFYNELIQLGFNISKSSRNYTISTTVEMPNLLNLSILVNEQNNTEAMKDEVLKDPYLFSIVSNLGYELNLINDQGFISTPEELFRYRFVPQGVFNRQESLLTLMIDESIYYPLRREANQSRLVEVNEMFDYAANSSLLQESNLFTLGYFMFPHLPWVADENGNETSANDRHNWQKSEIYLGQLKYSNRLILEMVGKIITNDPRSCIILMSDHAYRQPFHLQELFGKTIEDPVLESLFMRNILNAVYIAGDELQIEGLSGINTLRTVLDNLYSTNLGLIEESK